MKADSEATKRRTWLGSAASVGALIAGSIAIAPRSPMTEAIVKAEPEPVLEPGTGYQLTEHVKRYYATARV